MKIAERLRSVTRLFVDTAPLIYFVEGNALYLTRVAPIFALLDAGSLAAVTSPITLAECLIIPYRDHDAERRKLFSELITAGSNTTFFPIERVAADQAAELRARYNLSLADAMQLAVALVSGCDAFLTNDSAFGRVVELNIIMLDDLESS